MIESPEIVRSSAQRLASIHFHIPRTEMVDVMGPGIQELMQTLAEQEIAIAGPLLCYHHRLDADIFDFELALPVERDVVPEGRVAPSELPEVRVARTVMRGDYAGLGEAWLELGAWMEAEGHEPAGHLWERYLVGPGTCADPADWRTELNRVLTD